MGEPNPRSRDGKTDDRFMRCPHCAGPLTKEMETSEWTVPPLIRDSFSMIGSAVGGTAGAFYGFNHAMPIVRRWIKGPMWLHFLIGAPPVIIFSSGCAGLAVISTSTCATNPVGESRFHLRNKGTKPACQLCAIRICHKVDDARRFSMEVRGLQLFKVQFSTSVHREIFAWKWDLHASWDLLGSAFILAPSAFVVRASWSYRSNQQSLRLILQLRINQHF